MGDYPQLMGTAMNGKLIGGPHGGLEAPDTTKTDLLAVRDPENGERQRISLYKRLGNGDWGFAGYHETAFIVPWPSDN